MLRSLIALALFIPLSVHAENGTLFEHVPKGATPDVVVRIVTQAFTGRKWAISSSTESAVSASLKRRAYRVRLRVEYSNGALIYTGQAERLSPSGHPVSANMPRGSEWMPADLPMKWIENLKTDIGRMFATIPDR